MDGALNFQGSGSRLILTNPKGMITEYTLHLSFKAINNQAEYEALLTSLRLAKHLGMEHLNIFTDSQLVVG